MSLTVEVVAETRNVTYYRVSAGKHGGHPVTVRVGFHGIFCCLTCLVIDCIHAQAAEDFARAAPPIQQAS